jgi:hypothetical protein
MYIKGLPIFPLEQRRYDADPGFVWMRYDGLTLESEASPGPSTIQKIVLASRGVDESVRIEVIHAYAVHYPPITAHSSYIADSRTLRLSTGGHSV